MTTCWKICWAEPCLPGPAPRAGRTLGSRDAADCPRAPKGRRLEPVHRLLHVGQRALKMPWIASPAWAAPSQCSFTPRKPERGAALASFGSSSRAFEQALAVFFEIFSYNLKEKFLSLVGPALCRIPGKSLAVSLSAFANTLQVIINASTFGACSACSGFPLIISYYYLSTLRPSPLFFCF